MSAAPHQPPEGAAVRCDNVHLTFRLPEKQQRIKDIFMAPRRALRTRTFEALNGVSFSVGRGEILGVVGNNGAGKSTLLRVIGGIYHPDRGAVHEEMGDLLFACANLARHLGVDAEQALRDANAKFERRFRGLEAELERQGMRAEETGFEGLEAAYQAAKAADKDGG